MCLSINESDVTAVNKIQHVITCLTTIGAVYESYFNISLKYFDNHSVTNSQRCRLYFKLINVY